METDERLVAEILGDLHIGHDAHQHFEQPRGVSLVHAGKEYSFVTIHYYKPIKPESVTALRPKTLWGKVSVKHMISSRCQRFNTRALSRADQPLAPLTAFRVGGRADLLIEPRDAAELATAIVDIARQVGVAPFVLGAGANVVVSDAGVREPVVRLARLDAIGIDGTRVSAGAGSPISAVAARAADAGLAGLDFIYAMPGSTAGAVWMNARCYGAEIADVLDRVHYVTHDGALGVYEIDRSDFGYKVSPFQRADRIITAVEFALAPGHGPTLWRRMRALEADRRSKGHFDAPCAGSIFKNNRAFGAPSGRLLDRLGVRGRRRGGVRVSPRHANIVINDRNGSATDIRELVDDLADEARRRLGVELEPEVLFVGDWSGWSAP